MMGRQVVASLIVVRKKRWVARADKGRLACTSWLPFERSRRENNAIITLTVRRRSSAVPLVAHQLSINQ